ncbi:MAG: hypothetical protein QXT86_12550 [Archaeoglobaceae archaeon]
MKVDKTIDALRLYEKGALVMPFNSLGNLTKSIRSKDIISEISEDIQDVRAFYVKYKGYAIIVLPDHVHVLKDQGRYRKQRFTQPTFEESVAIVNELST